MGTTEFKFSLLGLLLIFPVTAFAYPGEPPHAARTVCAVLEKFEGEVQILNSDRSELIDTQPKAGIACGNWVSVGRGWAMIRHAQGYRFHAGSETFVQIQDLQAADNADHDHLLLFKGQVSVFAGKTMGELRVASANGRARIKNATGVLLFDSEKVETQLISLDGPITLENRFFARTATSKITLKAGESSILKLSSTRLIPSTPKALSVPALKNKLQELQFGESFQAAVATLAQRRSDRKLASELSVKVPPVKETPLVHASPALNNSGLELQPPVFAQVLPEVLDVKVETVEKPLVSPARNPARESERESEFSEEREQKPVKRFKVPQARSQIKVRSARHASSPRQVNSGEPEKVHLLQQLGEIQPD